MVFTAAPVEPTQSAPERQPEKVSYQPQPQSKKEPVSRLANELIQLSGFAAQLILQSHLVHLNFEGGNFFGVHQFTKEQYKKHQKQLDRLGELTRSLDFLMPMCGKGLLGSCKKFQHIKAYEGTAMLITYYENLEAFGMCAKDVAKLASKMDAFDIENYCGEIIEDCFTAAWQIKACLRCN
jgi:DNA-binding ferritin-like protein